MSAATPAPQQLEPAFRDKLEALLAAMPWGSRPAQDRRQYFGPDRQREWLQVDVWTTLQDLPGQPQVLAEFDTVPSDLEHNVAKYLWWVGQRPPFWNPPAILVSAFVMRKPHDYLLHENVARFLGHTLQERIPGTRHVLVSLRQEPDAPDPACRLAELAFQEVRAWITALSAP